MSDEEYEDEFDDESDNDIESDSIILRMNDKGELTKADPVYLDRKDFEKLNKGLILLKEKYPEISKECFSDE